MSAMLRVLALLVIALLPAFVTAHEMTMAEMEMRETRPGDFLWQWSATNETRATPIAEDLTAHWPEPCSSEPNLLHCGASGLKGTLGFDGLGKRYSAVILRIYWLDGQSRVFTLTARQPEIRLYGSAEDPRGRAEIAEAYTLLGIEHILSGYDHLLFVFGLLFLVGFNRKLLWTITAFTVAHSLTLASAAVGLLTLRSPPVEATIALSIVLVAAEALNKRETLARRWPAALAFLFGLVHGLGFAGALQEVGLPKNYLPTALFTFNVGVEIGQLVTVAAVWLVWRAIRRWPQTAMARVPLLYGIGSMAAYWSWTRMIGIFG
jgi:hydrogenase/urease accessory protein HupE